MTSRTMSDSRWQLIGLVLAGALVIPGVFLAAHAENRSGFTITLAAATPSGSSTTLGYRAAVVTGDRIDPHDFFRVHAVPGYVEGSATAPPGWAVRSEGRGPSPLTSPRGDEPDLVFTYLGPAPIIGPKLLNGFSARSTTGQPRSLRRFTGQCTRATGPGAGGKVDSAGVLQGPGAVPEPTSLLPTSLGVIILGIVYAHRHRRRLRVAA